MTDGNGVLSFQHVCDTTNSTEGTSLMMGYYSSDDCSGDAQFSFLQNKCSVSCVSDGESLSSRFATRPPCSE